MKVNSDRLTLRGVHPDLKRALDFRSQAEQTSMEKTVIAILEKELAIELVKIRLIDEIDSQLPVG